MEINNPPCFKVSAYVGNRYIDKVLSLYYNNNMLEAKKCNFTVMLFNFTSKYIINIG